MVRITNSVASHRRRQRLFKRAKGFWGDRKNHRKQTKDAVMKAQAFSYAHRKKKKADFRSLWITRVNVAAKMNGISYSALINGLKKANCLLNRKMLSELAIHNEVAFKEVVTHAKKALAHT